MLAESRAETLGVFDAVERALGTVDLAVPYAPERNPPRWELGHVGWFQDWWLARNPGRQLGTRADPAAPRLPARLADADALFDSSRIAHRERWHRPLPATAALRDDLACGLDATLALLDGEDAEDDDALYFFRLCLFHEDMHVEAAVMAAQGLGVPLDLPAPHAHENAGSLTFPGGRQPETGTSPCREGFAFDNELGRGAATLPPFTIDAAPVSWGRFLAFVDDGGYGRRACWSDAGWAWRQRRDANGAAAPGDDPEAGPRDMPRSLRRHGGGWQRLAFGRWLPLDPALPAMQLACHEAEAFATWAGRRLPTEAEWEHAALEGGASFAWGEVWDWTASGFAPHAGFVAHPYRDYSVPAFADGRRVLRGGSFATSDRMRHPRYRNFFAPGRDDVFAGFRTCAGPTARPPADRVLPP